MRLLALIVLLLGIVGCGRHGTDISQSLQKGDAALKSMAAAATERNYELYFQQYEILRNCYISAATEIQQDRAQGDRDEFLQVLQGWERAIAVARAAWASLDAKTPLPTEIQNGLRPDVSDMIQKLDEESQRARDKISAEWAPFESKLDELIAAMHELPGNQK